MVIFNVPNKELLNHKMGTITSRSCYSLILFATLISLTSCSNLHFNNSKAALLDLGQMLSHDECSKYTNPHDYQTCISQVDQNYGEVMHDLKLKTNSQ